MRVIAENLNFRNRAFIDALRKGNNKEIASMAKTLEAEGADAILVQCTSDGQDDERLLPLATGIIQSATNLPICLDSRNAAAIAKAIPLCDEPPLINYCSPDESGVDEILKLARESRAEVVLRAVRGMVPTTIEAKLLILEELIERANAADMPNERLYADPSVVHIGRGMGQEHLMNTHACVIALNEMVDPPINTIAWISNVSSGLPKSLRPAMNAAFLCYLAGAGLDCAILDVTDREVMKMVYLIRSFRDEIVFSPSDIT